MYPKRIDARVHEELPYMMGEPHYKLVANREWRQEAHEHIRILSRPAGSVVKNEGKSIDLVSRLKATDISD